MTVRELNFLVLVKIIKIKIGSPSGPHFEKLPFKVSEQQDKKDRSTGVSVCESGPVLSRSLVWVTPCALPLPATLVNSSLVDLCQFGIPGELFQLLLFLVSYSFVVVCLLGF